MSRGDVYLVVNGDVVVGTELTPDATYRIRSAGDRLHAIRQIDPSTLPPEGEPLIPRRQPPAAGGSDVASPATADADGSVIDVPVFYTSVAQLAEGGSAAIDALIDLMVGETNQAYADSGVIQRGSRKSRRRSAAVMRSDCGAGPSTHRRAASFMARPASTYWWVLAVSSWPIQRAMTRIRSVMTPTEFHFRAFLILVTMAAILAVAPGAGREAPDTETQAIVDQALERAVWALEQEFQTQFRYSMTQRERTFNGDGGVTSDETRVYAIEPSEGIPYASLITRNGEPISGDDLEDEAERREGFLKRLRDSIPDDEENDQNDYAFGEELIARYTATLTGVRELRGRPSYVLEFKPRAGRLPVRRRIDHVLNKSRGEIWIDEETYEVARVSAQLMESVRLWWGVLGSISDARGTFERAPIADDVWLPIDLDIYFHVRVLFRTNRRAETTLWQRHEPLGG